MGEFLRNSVTITSNGFACKYYSFSRSNCGCRIYCESFHHCLDCGLSIKTKRRLAGVCNLNVVSVPMKGYTWFECKQQRTPQMNLRAVPPRIDDSVIVSNTFCSVDSEMVCGKGEENKLIQRGQDRIGSNSFGQNVPPCEVFMVHHGQNFEPGSDGEPFTDSKDAKNECRLHFLEETDEEMLSRRILTLSRSNKVRSVLELFGSMKFSGLQPNVHACNSLLSCLLRNGLFDNALSVFEFMRMNDITTGHTYSLMLKAIGDTHGCDSALNMFADLERDSKPKDNFDVIVYNTMISICGRVNNSVETERIWRSMKDNGHIGTEVTYSLLVSIFVRCGQSELALNAYNEMIENGLRSGSDAMHATISACTKEGKWDLALKVFQNMLNNELKPNLIACNALINSLGKAGKVELAFKVCGIMKLLGHEADEYTWNALLSALYRANRHADVLQLFDSMKTEQHSQLNVHLYNTALMSCQKLRSWQRALQLLWQMEASGLSVSTASYNLVIGACEIARKPKVALQVYERMVHQKCTPDTFTHLSLLRSCVWGSLWDEVEEILKWVPPNVSLYNAALHGMCLRGKIKSAKKLYMRMQEIGLKPDGKTRALMLQNLRKDSKRTAYLSW